MVDTVTTAVYKVETRGADSVDTLAHGLDALAISEEKVTRATRTTEEGFDRLRARLDPAVRAHQAYEASLQKVARYEADGIGTAQERARVVDLATRKYMDQVAALERAALAHDRYNRAAQSGPGPNSAGAINQRLGVADDFGTAAKAADVAAYGKALDDVRAKFVPLYSAGRQYKDTLSDINQAAKVGAISETERAAAVMNTKVAFVEHVNSLRGVRDATDITTAAAGRFTAGSGLARHELINLSRQAQDVVVSLQGGQGLGTVLLQQGSQIGDVFASSQATVGGAVKQITSYLGSFLTVGRLAFGGVALAITGAGVALNSYLGSQERVTLALSGAGRGSGASAGSINAAANAGASLGGLSVASARDLGAAIAATGKIANDNMLPIIKLGHDFATTFGVNDVEATKMLAQAFADPVKGAEQLNDRLGFLDAAMQREIGSLAAQNRMYEAQQVLLAGVQSSLAKSSEVTSFWSQMWTGLKNASSNFFDYIGQKLANGLGLNDSLQQQADALKKNIAGFDSGIGRIFGSSADRQALVEQLDKVNAKLEAQARATQNVAAAQASLRQQQTIMAQLPEVAQRRALSDSATVAGAVAEDPIAQRANGITQQQADRTLAIWKQLRDDFRVTAQAISANSKIAFDAVTAFSPSSKATIAQRQAVEQYRDTPGISPEEKAKIGQDAYNLSLKQSLTALSEAARARELSAKQSVASAQLEIDMVGKSVGQQAEMRATLQARQALEQQLLQQHEKWGPAQDEELSKLEGINKKYGERVQKGAEDAAQKQADFERQIVGLTDIEKQIAAINFQLYGVKWKDFMNSGVSNTRRVTSEIDQLNQATAQFGNSLLSGLLRGDNVLKALTGSASTLIQTLASKNLDSFLKGGSVFGNQNLASGQGALAVGSAGLAGYQSGNALTGALGGAMAGATFGPAGAVVGGIVGLVGGIIGASDKSRQKLQQAQEIWRQAGPAFETFLKQMSGGQQGSVSKAISDASAQEAAFEKQAWEARDTAAINAARAGLQKFSDTQKRQFSLIFDSIAKGFETGFGPDSAFLKSVNTVKGALESTLGFIDDAKEVFGDAAKGENGAAAARATAAARTYLLALLNTPEPLSQVQQGLQAIQGTASALQNALTQLGMSSADAATAINAGVSKSIAGLKTQFEAGLTERLNTANGQSFLSDATRLVSQHQQDLIDAAALGVDQAAVAALFHAEAQKIVNDSGLVGDAFTSFTKQFPTLAGVVTQASQDVSDAVKQQQSALNSSAKTILDYVNSITAGPGSTLSPQDRYAAAESVYNAKLVLAQAGNVDAQSTIPQDAENYRAAAQAMFGSASGYQSVVSQIRTQLLALPAVTVTTDPQLQVMRDVLTSINAGILSQATDATLTGTIKAAIDAGNAAQVATALSTYFNRIDTNTSQTIDLGEMQSALAGMASNSALVSMFTRLDTDNSGAIDRLELIKASSAVIGFNTLNAVDKANLIVGNTETTVSNTGGTQVGVDANNALTGTGNATLATATAQLDLLRLALSPTVISKTFSGGGSLGAALPGAGSGHDYILQNQVVDALNKIVLNTYLLTQNTAYTEKSKDYAGDEPKGHGYIGTYATGGWITGGISGVDSVRILGQRDEFMVNPYATRALTRDYGPGVMDLINSGRLPSMNDNSARPFVASPNVIPIHSRNDNAELLARIDRLTAEVAALRKENNRGHGDTAQAATGGARHVREGVDNVHDAQKELKRAGNMRR
jgi:hypothetical protein